MMTKNGAAFILCVLCSLAVAPRAAQADPTLSTDDTTKHVTLEGRAVVTLSPGTELVRERSLRLELDGPAAGPIPVEVFRLTRGSAEVRFPKEGQRKGVMIRTPRRLVVVSKRGAFRALIQNGVSTVAALEDDALATAGTDWKPMTAGTARSVGGSESGEARKVLPAPKSRGEARLVVATGASAGAELRWDAVKDAATYAVEIQQDGASAASPFVLQRVSRPTHRVSELQPGRYRVRVAAVDAFGLAGPWAAAGSIQVVGVRLPAGARLDDGRIWLSPSARVRLTSADNVELTYGRASYFVPAPQSIGLYRGRPTVVRLRAAGSPSEARLELLPVQLSATVQLTPALPRWPADEVRAVVSFEARGTSLPKADPRMTVNGRPVSARWTRKGATFSAVVPKGSGAGPWVVRVEALNDDKRVVGRGFIEVVEGGTTAPSAARRAAIAKR
ncbi:MAG: fibronectin type III domain-containing protein [Polyangiaceae bacterium]